MSEFALPTILLAEDNPRDAELTVAALAERGPDAAVVVVRDGREALDYLRSAGGHKARPEGNPALLLLDLRMPKLDGLAVLRAVKGDARLRSIPVVVLTASADETDRANCYASGANAYVVKPAAHSDFILALEHLATFWAAVNERPPAVTRRVLA
jgi:CheY-like chemotaxis protein